MVDHWLTSIMVVKLPCVRALLSVSPTICFVVKGQEGHGVIVRLQTLMELHVLLLLF